MTEDEAKTKWCPMARTPDGNRFAYASAAGLKTDGIDPDYIAESVGLFPCLGSACMAWRWHAQVFDRGMELWSKSLGERVSSARSDDAEWRPSGEDVDKYPPPAAGYCGLAGPLP